ncbi:flagellar biosynthesis protein FlhB [Caulobacter sp. RHG1]|uniref:flagellar biosynthesis protein FlhB n=1 Tax=Caulobacter sp. (strain RHG1) TaxID=2545762 RepID=UPI001552041B|nr:flagellar biosynthesis protein FlhB [Caulobacter sp. RHG1]NQE60716.1 Flagellar biosynthesis protein FlhB [Caulobacter sp. RHG1]
MADDADPESKTEDPSAKKLSDARAKGDVVKSMDIPQLASLAGAISVILIAGGWLTRDLAAALYPFIAHAGTTEISSGGAMVVMKQAVMAAMPPLLLVMIVTAVMGVVANVAQTGFMLTPEKIKPDFKKLDLLKGLGRIFGMDGMVQFAKSTIKFLVTGFIAYMVLKPHVGEVRNLVGMDVAALLPEAMKLSKSLMLAVLLLLIAMAAIDWFWQRQRFMKRMRMTLQEVKDEFKQSDGDPHIKGKRRQIQMQRSRQRMMQAVPKATVVVMNPTHYAVALKYEPGETPAPLCVAKGVDELALKIRAVAEEHGVMVLEDPPLARALYASVEIDEEIPVEHFEAVAKVISFIMNGKKPQARG